MSPKYSPRPLTMVCGVCGAPAPQVIHHGSVACYSCRAFFRRCVEEKKTYDLCVRGEDDCLVDKVNRTNCKKCRLARCFKIGMKGDKVAHRKNKPRKKNKTGDGGDGDNGGQITIRIDISPGETLSESESTVTNGETVDICDIAEECVLEELSTPMTGGEAEAEADQLSSILQELLPSPLLTIEEEFRICELEAAKEFLMVNIFRSLEQQIPNLKDGISMFFFAITMGFPIDFRKKLSFMKRKRECIKNDLIFGGCVKNVLNSVQIFENVPESAMVETFQFSLGAAEMCMRAFMKINDDKVLLIDQKKAAGINFSLFDDILSDAFFDKQAVPCIQGFGPFNLFQSPWAQNARDEEYFSDVLTRLGEIVKDDVKLGTLYLTLVLATPSSEASEETRSNPSLEAVQQEVRLLIYRYLSYKHSQSTAGTLYNNLMAIISDLFTCDKIHVFGRLEDNNSELNINQYL